MFDKARYRTACSWVRCGGRCITQAKASSSTVSRATEELRGRARSNKWDLCNFRYVKKFSALRMGTGRAFHKAGPDIENALDPVLVFIRGTTNLYESVERRYFEHFARPSESARKIIVYILKMTAKLDRKPVIVSE